MVRFAGRATLSVKHASQASVVCDYSKLNNASPAQCAPAERIDTRVNDRLPDGAQEYWTVEDIVEAFS